jgi:uncharacterized protein (TIGR03067 family)
MKLVCVSMLVWLCGGALALGEGAGKTEDDSKRMQGTWRPVAAKLGGSELPDEVRKTIKLVVTDGKYAVTVGREGTDEGTIKLDPAQKPRAMDIVGTKGPNKGKTIPAIYELTDGTLRICYDLGGKARPTEFQSKPETQLFLVTYERAKP